MPPTLASLVRNPALHLTVLAAEDRLDVPVLWVHTSELDDPAPFLEGGELLLTTGMKFRPAAADLRAYVHRLADAGVVGLGVGVGLTHERVPPPLVEAAGERGLPLLEVPQPTPFIAISKVVSAALAAEQYQAVTSAFEAQQELTRAALGTDGLAAVVRQLARRVDGWAALYDASGRIVHAAPHWAGRRADRLTAEVDRLRGHPAPTSAAVQDPCDEDTTDYVELQSLGAGRRARGFLAVGTGRRLNTTERYVVHGAVALITMGMEQSRSLQEAAQRLGAAVLHLLLAGEPDQARAVAGDLYGALLDAAVRVVVAEVRPGQTAGRRVAGRPPGTAEPTGDALAAGPLAALADHLDGVSAHAGEPLLSVPGGRRLTVLAADGGAVHRTCLTYAAEAQDLAVGISCSLPPGSAADARDQAVRALAVARRRGQGPVGYEEVGAGSVVPLLSDDAVRAYAEGLLRPLREHDETSRGDLVASLYTWLSRHGQWDAAAADLGVHRHTLRNRMRRVEDLLGRSLDDADVRMQLWLALQLAHAPS